MICEMRFQVPNSELSLWQEEQKDLEGGGRSTDGIDSKPDQMTAAKVLNEKIQKRVVNPAGLESAIITSVQDLALLTPRGNFSLDFYESFARLHGKTHDHKMSYGDINKVFMLQQPDKAHIVYVLQLDSPLS